jgi:hypothetical protein
MRFLDKKQMIDLLFDFSIINDGVNGELNGIGIHYLKRYCRGDT